jgi:endoglucanase
MNRLLILGLLIFVLAGCIPTTQTPSVQPTQPMTPYTIFELNQRLARTVNLGNALEAPNEGEWGVTLQEEYFDRIAGAGFTAVRIPIRFSAHAGMDAPYTIDPAFLSRVDWAVDQANARGLTAIVDLHHYMEAFTSPFSEKERFIGIWAQLAGHYQGYPDELLFFELLNEPNGVLVNAIWNEAAAETLAVVRQTNPTRPVIIGPGNWNAFDSLPGLELPADDRNIIVTFHYYLPFQFTHQGADWAEGSDAWLGTTWEGTPGETAALTANFDSVAVWADEQDRPIFLGEFGAYEEAGMASRVRWTEAVRRAAEERGFAWGYWEFCAGFGLYDPETSVWREELLHALIP